MSSRSNKFHAKERLIIGWNLSCLFFSNFIPKVFRVYHSGAHIRFQQWFSFFIFFLIKDLCFLDSCFLFNIRFIGSVLISRNRSSKINHFPIQDLAVNYFMTFRNPLSGTSFVSCIFLSCGWRLHYLWAAESHSPDYKYANQGSHQRDVWILPIFCSSLGLAIITPKILGTVHGRYNNFLTT